MKNNTPRPYWSSMTSYLLVTTGAIVGLGNIIRFPFYIYKYGGLFFIFYVLFELLICIPILFAELLIGRRGKQNPVGAFSLLAMETGASRAWRGIGWLCFVILFLTLGSYTVSVAFPTIYLVNTINIIINKTVTSPLSSSLPFNIKDHTIVLETCLLFFLFVTMLVILRGINRGLETISRITVPLYTLILLGLAIYSGLIGHFTEAISHLFDFTPDDSLMTVIVAALSYAFFKLNIGMGSMIVYGSYLPYSVPIGRSTLLIICFDAIISLLAYFVISPLFDPTATLSTVLSYQENLFSSLLMEQGNLISLLFFLAVIIAAWTPTIAIAESATVILIERWNLSRRIATGVVFAGAILIGTSIILSYHTWGNLIVFHEWSMTRLVDGITSTLLIPLSAFLISIFAGWILKRKITSSELGFNPKLYVVWRFLLRWIAPLLIVVTALMLLNF